MKRRFSRLAVAALCISLGVVGSRAVARAQSSRLWVPYSLPQGGFTIEPGKTFPTLTLMAREAPVLPLLQAAAQRSNVKATFSDEVQEKLQGLTLSGIVSGKPQLLEYLLGMFAGNPKHENYGSFALMFDDSERWKSTEARVSTENCLSWGKLGTDTYLVVLRRESAADIAARKASVEIMEEQYKRNREEAAKRRRELPQDDLEDDPYKARVWLLAPQKQ